MSRKSETLEPAYFEAVYAADSDPWKFASSDYERSKYAATLAALPRDRYASAFEVGCSIGVLTSQLAARCDTILAVDAAAAPLVEARRRCAALSNVRFEQMFVPEQWPNGAFNLLVLSEVVYYLCAADVARLATRVTRSLSSGADVVLVHWTDETDYPLSGDQAADLFIESTRQTIPVLHRERSDRFRLDVLRRR